MSADVEKDLREETEKWIRKIESHGFEAVDTEESRRFVDNIRAYVEDSKHFLEEGKLIQAFEAVVWAWSWLEIGRDLDIVE